jgi:phosphoserine phosphatase RsbU/P
LKPGDLFVFCSDGISETFSESGEEFGSARIVEVAREHADRPAKEIVAAVFGAMQTFRGDAPQTDDQTVVVVKIAPEKPPKPAKETPT